MTNYESSRSRRNALQEFPRLTAFAIQEYLPRSLAFQEMFIGIEQDFNPSGQLLIKICFKQRHANLRENFIFRVSLQDGSFRSDDGQRGSFREYYLHVLRTINSTRGLIPSFQFAVPEGMFWTGKAPPVAVKSVHDSELLKYAQFCALAFELDRHFLACLVEFKILPSTKPVAFRVTPTKDEGIFLVTSTVLARKFIVGVADIEHGLNALPAFRALKTLSDSNLARAQLPPTDYSGDKSSLEKFVLSELQSLATFASSFDRTFDASRPPLSLFLALKELNHLRPFPNYEVWEDFHARLKSYQELVESASRVILPVLYNSSEPIKPAAVELLDCFFDRYIKHASRSWPSTLADRLALQLVRWGGWPFWRLSILSSRGAERFLKSYSDHLGQVVSTPAEVIQTLALLGTQTASAITDSQSY